MLFLHLVLQMPPPPDASWERVGTITLLVVGLCLVGGAFLREWVVPGKRYAEKAAECEEEKKRADANDQKYVNVLIADIQERKDRDRTLELLTKAVSANSSRREE